MKSLLKKILPERLFSFYHYLLAVTATIYYRFPAKKVIVIGITGTKGKTSSANFIWSCLTAGGYKTGIISTANIRIGTEEVLNKYHMTMPGAFRIQKMLAEMVKKKCKFCVVETTSEGIKQSRHIGVYYDIAVFTNLTPEHLPSHEGSFEKYKHEKTKMFKALTMHRKKLDGKDIQKSIIANVDSEHANTFLSFEADTKVTFAIDTIADYRAEKVVENNSGVQFSVSGIPFSIAILGKCNVYNALPAIIISRIFGISDTPITQGLTSLKVIPGRMEKIDEGQDFTVLVDYAHEKISITNVLQTALAMKNDGGRVIIIIGAEGGGRDKAKRADMGALAARMADFVVVSNVDPYSDDPKEILEDIAIVVEENGKKRGNNLFVIEDRTEGIRKTLSLANRGDVVLITGKGAEQSMIIDGKSIPWDDRDVVRKELRALLDKV